MIQMNLGIPVSKEGFPLPKYTRPQPPETLDSENPFTPFADRLEHDFAHHHFVKAQSSASKIAEALDLWMAQRIQAAQSTEVDDVPWKTANDMYQTIDQIQHGHTPFRTYYFKYSGPRPIDPPSWMLQTYELCLRDSRAVIHHQLANQEFAKEFHAAPYQQFQADGDRVWSNVMSGEWAWNEAVRIAPIGYIVVCSYGGHSNDFSSVDHRQNGATE